MKYYIQDTRSYVGNAVVWWGHDNSGYTSYIEKAGLYTEKQAREICKRKTDIAWPEAHIKQAIRQIVDSQFLDSKKARFKRGS